MSLLMDALKKAEQAKRKTHAGSGSEVPAKAPQDFELAPLESILPPLVAPSAPLPELPAHLSFLDDEFQLPPLRTPVPATSASKTPASPAEPLPDESEKDRENSRAKRPVQRAAAAPTSARAGEREAAQNVFQVKQASDSNKLFPIVLATFSLIAVAVIGLYFWMQLRPDGNGIVLAPTGTPQPTPPAPQPGSQPMPASLPTSVAAGDPRRLSPDAGANRGPSPGAAPQHLASPVVPVDVPIHITTARLQINPALERGYEAFSAGKLEAARGEYEQLLKGEPKNGEALLGMAAISLRQGQPNLAEEYYLRAIEADPKDALAQSGLIALRGQADPVQSESALKNLISAQPALPSLQFVLGNLYARQGRWNEAQQAYFRAYTADSDNPDVIFNLAVSLDHLHRLKLAAQYYIQALAASANRQAGFDPAQVNARLRDLSQATD